MKKFTVLFTLFFCFGGFSVTEEKKAEVFKKIQIQRRNDFLKKSQVPLLDKGNTLEKQIEDSFFDPNYDYSRFTGRVTDRDDGKNLVKISSENGNIKFFRSGDLVKFRQAASRTKQCRGFVRSVEGKYFVMHIEDITVCWGRKEYLRRGAMMVFEAHSLSSRVRDASSYRILLLRRRRDFYKQLNDVNHFVWSYDQERIKLAAEYDEKITKIRQAKQRALDMLGVKKLDSINLQKELKYRLDQLDQSLDHYRVDKDDPKIDRWHLDHNLGKPVAKRPKSNYFSN